MTIYHGGIAGLSPGDWILPPSRTGADHHRAEQSHRDYTPHRVYVTSGLYYAQMFAYLRDGAVYEVEPQGQVRADEDSGVAPSWSCRRAQVCRVVVPAPAPFPAAADIRRLPKWARRSS